MRVSFSVALFVCIISFFGGSVIAHPLLGDPLAETDNGVADGTTGLLSDLDGGAVAADNFVLAADTDLTGVRWWGGFGDNGPGFPGSSFPVFPTGIDYILTVYADSGTGPSDTIVGTSTLTLFGAPISDITFSGLGVWEITAVLDTHLLGLSAGTTYWVSIVGGEVDGNVGSFWASSDDSGDAHADFLSGMPPAPTAPWGAAGVELAFILFGEESAIVPEPTSFALLGMGALGFMGYGWRRRKAGVAG